MRTLSLLIFTLLISSTCFGEEIRGTVYKISANADHSATFRLNNGMELKLPATGGTLIFNLAQISMLNGHNVTFEINSDNVVLSASISR